MSDSKVEDIKSKEIEDDQETKSWQVLTSSDDTTPFMLMRMETYKSCTAHSFYECKRQYKPDGEHGAKYHHCGRVSALQLAIDGLAIPNVYNDMFERKVVFWSSIKSKNGAADYDDSTVCYSVHPRPEWKYTHWVIVRHDGTVHVCGKTAETSRVNTYFSPAIYPCALEAYWLIVQAEAKRGNKLAIMIVPLLRPFSVEASGCRPQIRNFYSACIYGLFEGKWKHRREYKSQDEKEKYLEALQEMAHDVIFDHSVPKPTLETMTTEFRGISIVRIPGNDLRVKVPHSGCTDASFDYSVRGPYGHLFDRYANVIECVDVIEETSE